jgi:hypothetical protein
VADRPPDLIPSCPCGRFAWDPRNPCRCPRPPTETVADLRARLATLEAERDEARKRAKTWKAAARSWFASGRFSVGMLRVKALRRERNAAESRSAALADALRALHDIVLMREAGATDLYPDLARAMARARELTGGDGQ